MCLSGGPCLGILSYSHCVHRCPYLVNRFLGSTVCYSGKVNMINTFSFTSSPPYPLKSTLVEVIDFIPSSAIWSELKLLWELVFNKVSLWWFPNIHEVYIVSSWLVEILAFRTDMGHLWALYTVFPLPADVPRTVLYLLYCWSQC